jgi:hypothetical protein
MLELRNFHIVLAIFWSLAKTENPLVLFFKS